MRTIIRIEDSDFNEMQQYEEEYVNARNMIQCVTRIIILVSHLASTCEILYDICESLYAYYNHYFGKMSF